MRNNKLCMILCLMGLLMASCKEDKNTEWENFYGYTNNDIIGTYSYSNVPDAFDGIVGVGRYSCPNAEIDIKPYAGSQVELSINCPTQGFNRSFSGKSSPNSNDFMVRMSSGYKPYGNGLRAYNVTGYVLKNAQQQLRIHGYASVNTYRIIVTPEGIPYDTVVDNGTYYYFDVIKN